MSPLFDIFKKRRLSTPHNPEIGTLSQFQLNGFVPAVKPKDIKATQTFPLCLQVFTNNGLIENVFR